LGRVTSIVERKERIFMRIMAIDYGDARTGVAISDATGLLAGETRVIQSRKQEVVLGELAELARQYQVSELVLGYPKNMNGTVGPRAEKSEVFAELLRETTGLPVLLWDERRTTVDAHRILSETGNRGKRRKEKVDAVAATLILEGYLIRKKLEK
jgi:putative Holliday junction resolvase